MNSQQLELHDTLKAGVWLVAFVVDGKKVATTEFLVVPHVGDQSLTLDVKDNQSLASWAKYKTDDVNLIRSRRDRESLLEKDISSYLDKIVVEFYSIQDICYAAQLPKCLSGKRNHDWQSCLTTDWSSFSRDPKSELI